MMGVMSQGREQAAAQVTARRGALGMTQKQLALTARVDIKTIYNLESGERWPQASTRAKIEKALGWAIGTLEALSEGRDLGPQLPTRAELLDDGLRRSGLTPEQVRARASVSEEEWHRLAAVSTTGAAARAEDPALAPALGRVALHLGILPTQLDDAGQHQAAAVARELLAATGARPAEQPQAADPADVELRRLLEAWLRLDRVDRRRALGVIEEMVSDSAELDTRAGKPDQVDERRRG